MEFNLGEYKIKTDERQYILYKLDFVKESRFTKAENVGKNKWKAIAHFTRLEHALKFIPQDIVRYSDDCLVVIDKLTHIEAIITDLIKGVNIK